MANDTIDNDAIRHLVFTTRYSLFTIRYSLFSIRRLPFTNLTKALAKQFAWKSQDELHFQPYATDCLSTRSWSRSTSTSTASHLSELYFPLSIFLLFLPLWLLLSFAL